LAEQYHLPLYLLSIYSLQVAVELVVTEVAVLVLVGI
jgi:hypothetical protein